MTGRENLEMTARLFGHGRRAARRVAVAVLSQLGLDEVADRWCGTYSGGQRRGLELGASLAGAAGSCSPRTTWRTQAAQGMSLIAFVFAFISSAYVPAGSMRAGCSRSPSTSRSPRWSTRSARCSPGPAAMWGWPWPGLGCCC
jgi:hypothetical protein